MISETELPVGPGTGPLQVKLNPVCPGVPVEEVKPETVIEPNPPLQGRFKEEKLGLIALG